MASLKSKLALAVSNQDFVRAAQLKKEIDDQKSKQDVHETTVRQFPFAATLQASEREALSNEAIGTVKIDLTSATTLVLSSFREAMFRSDRGGHHALAKLRQVFKAMDTDASGSIDASELETGLLKFGITLTRHDLNMLFAACDTDGSGGISVDEFLASLSGEISTRRRRLITEAFKKLDRNGDGELRVNDLKKIFGEGRAAKLDFLLRTFDENSDGTVTEAEFLLYYSDLSASIKNDDAFEVMIRNAFHLSGGEGAAASTTSMRVMCFFDVSSG
jgi:Ca2+-binding EF-hand superfamily protein